MKGGRRAYFWLLIGTTGSGKTTTARTILKKYLPKPDFLVVVNSSSELAEFCRKRIDIDSRALEREWKAEELARIIRQFGAVHLEVTGGGEPKRIRAFMDALGHACMLLGRKGAKRTRLLLVVDEAANYLSRATFAPGTRRVFAEGRKYGIDALVILQQLTGPGGDALDITVRRMQNIILVHPMSEPVECKRVTEVWPQMLDPRHLAMPSPEHGRAGEYQIYDRYSGKTALVRVASNGKRYAVPLTLPGGPGPPGNERRAA